MLFRTLSLVFVATAWSSATSLTLPQGASLHPPVEGRWSIGVGWTNEWPAEWRHAGAERTEIVGEWTIHHGSLVIDGGTLKLRDAVRARGTNLVEVRRRWEWTGEAPLTHVTLSVRWQLDARETRPFLPGISYYDNPAGQSVDATRIPVIGSHKGARGFYEEHRFPMPFACVEGSVGGSIVAAAVHSLPSPVHYGNQADQWWTLGVERREDGMEMALLSGAIASNGRDGVIKANQRSFLEHPGAWSALPPGAIVDKTFFLELVPASARGSGFRGPLWTSIRLFEPFNPDGFPPLREILALKFRDSENRWHEDDQCAGIHAFPGETRPWIDCGWAGQSEAVAFPMLRLGTRFGIESAQARHYAQSALDFISSAPIEADGFPVRYDFKAHEWIKRTNPLSQGQTLNNMLHALRAARRDPAIDASRWETFLRRSCALHADRILSDNWRPKSTAEGFLIAPLAQGGGLFNEPRLSEAAGKAADHYASRHLSMDEPYWGGTLDARCEDKEGAWAAFQGFLALHDATGESRYLEYARHAADVVLSYMYVWDVPMPPGRLADHAFKSRGWTAVSVQNMHLDVYGVLCAPAFHRLGELTGNTDYHRLARLLLVSCGQLVDPWGSQGEQIHQTHYAQHYQVKDYHGVRGDYIESWNVYWISAHFLSAAAALDEMGVDCTAW